MYKHTSFGVVRVKVNRDSSVLGSRLLRSLPSGLRIDTLTQAPAIVRNSPFPRSTGIQAKVPACTDPFPKQNSTRTPRTPSTRKHLGGGALSIREALVGERFGLSLEEPAA